MKKSAKLDPLAKRPNLDFSKAVRGKYTNLLAKGTNLAIIEPDLHTRFPDSASVNRALRAFLAINDEVRSASKPMRLRRSGTVAATPEFGSEVCARSQSETV